MTRLPFLASIRGIDGRVKVVEVVSEKAGTARTILTVPAPALTYQQGFADGEAAALDSIPLDYLSPDDGFTGAA
jgi:hypothetical protein